MRFALPLDSRDLQYIQNIAQKRNKKEGKFGAMTYGDKLGGEQAHLIGLAAELAIARSFNLNIDEEIFNNRGDKGVDLVIPTDKQCFNVAIKATTYKDEPFLRAEVEHNHPNIDIYILCYVNKEDLSDVEFIGWQYRELVEKAKVRKFSKYGPKNYVLTEKELSLPAELYLKYYHKEQSLSILTT